MSITMWEDHCLWNEKC